MNKLKWLTINRVRHAWLGLCVLALLVSACGGGSSGSGSSVPGSTITTTIVLADAGDIIGIRVGGTAQLDGSASTTTSSNPLTYAWSFTHKPTGSTAVLINPTSVNPTFIPDVEGTYSIQLVVTSGQVVSDRAIAIVEASVSGNYTGNRIHTSFPSRCLDCHDGRYVNGLPPIQPIRTKSGNHLAMTNRCEACHTTFGFNLIRYVDHKEVFGKCSGCHDGVKAIGKSAFHIDTTVECDACHTSTDSFLPLDANGKYDHSNVTRPCSGCHNGTIALGKTPTHVATPTGSECNDCHRTTGFKPAFVDHSTLPLTTRCDSCHGNPPVGTATPMIAGHPDMSPVDCRTCHVTSSFNNGGTFNHRVAPTEVACETCHTPGNVFNVRSKSSKVGHVATTQDCYVCHGAGGGNFANGVFDHSTISGGTRCDSCHAAPPTGDASGMLMHANHFAIAPGKDCGACHTPGTFITGTFDHDFSGYSPTPICNDCHNGTNSIGKTPTHIPTVPDGQVCSDCHLNFTSFKGATVDHSTISSGCSTCHDGTIATGKTAGLHLPTMRDCSDCHVYNAAGFTAVTPTFDHLDDSMVAITSGCESCHNGVIARDKTFITNHIPSPGTCATCHQDTNVGGFVNTIFLASVHPNYATGCEGCHKAQFLSAKPTLLKDAVTHVPTTQDCHACHTNTAFTPNIFTHDGINDGCSTCHDGNYVTPANALGKINAPTTHVATTAECYFCHSIGTSFFPALTFDHSTLAPTTRCDSCHAPAPTGNGSATPKTPTHITTTEDCGACHVGGGTFKNAVYNHAGIVNNCASCHDVGQTGALTKKGPTHLPTADDCSACHNTTAFAGAKYDHTGITSGCATCHDGVIALGKTGTHVPTSDDCSVCHFTTGFKPANFSHAGITNNCESCHDGFFATGKAAKVDHVQTNQDCGLCHNTTAFKPATYDHSSLDPTIRCDSCHGVWATGKEAKTNPLHWITTLDCRDCHTTATFLGGTWIHEPSAANNCDSCHSTLGGATVKSPTHLNTTVQCDVCHSTTAWAPTIFAHDPAGDYPGDHARKPTCDKCHGGTISATIPYPFSTYAPFCAACHADKFASVDKHNGGGNGTVEQNKDCSGGGSGCHSVKQTWWN